MLPFSKDDSATKQRQTDKEEAQNKNKFRTALRSCGQKRYQTHKQRLPQLTKDRLRHKITEKFAWFGVGLLK